MDADFQIYKYTRDRNPNSHFHECYELLIPLNNEGKFFVRRNGYQMRFGMAFLLKPFEIHRCFCDGNREYDRYVIHFSGEILRRMGTANTDLASLFDTAPPVLTVPDGMLATLLGLLFSFSKPVEGSFGKDVERNIQFQHFLLLFGRLIGEQDGPAPALECEKRVNDILQYIHEHYARELSVESLAQEFFVSKSRLSQIFKDATGFSVGDYIITYRIKKACSLLQSGMRVQDVSDQVGFRTSTHFIRTFKKRTGVSPGEFARESGAPTGAGRPGPAG